MSAIGRALTYPESRINSGQDGRCLPATNGRSHPRFVSGLYCVSGSAVCLKCPWHDLGRSSSSPAWLRRIDERWSAHDLMPHLRSRRVLTCRALSVGRANRRSAVSRARAEGNIRVFALQPLNADAFARSSSRGHLVLGIKESSALSKASATTSPRGVRATGGDGTAVVHCGP